MSIVRVSCPASPGLPVNSQSNTRQRFARSAAGLELVREILHRAWAVRTPLPRPAPPTGRKGPAAGFLLLLFVGFVPPSRAQENPPPAPEPEPVVVTVSARAIPLSVTSAAVTVIDQKRIEESGAETVADLLRSQPGLDVVQSGPRGSFTSVSMRGAEENFSLVLLDGIPLNDPTDSQGRSVDLASLSLVNIERIEVVRGPLSALYGSEALGGVINIITRRGQGAPRLVVDAQGGSFGSGLLGASVSGNHRRVDYSLGGSYDRIGEQVENDRFSLGAASAKIGIGLNENTDLDFVLRLARRHAEGFPENGGGPVYSLLRDPQVIQSQDGLFGARIQHQLADTGVVDFGFDTFHQHQDSHIPPILDQLPPSFDTIPSRIGTTRFNRHRLSLGLGWKLSPHVSANLSGRFIREDGLSDFLLAEFMTSTFDVTRNTGAVGGELLYVDDRLTAQFGGRVDKGGGFDAQFSPRGGVRVELLPGFDLKANLGRGFKLPSFFAFCDPMVGNPDLRPEKNLGLDIGVEKGFPNAFTLEILYFHNSFVDLIDFSPELFRLVNRTATTTQGVEATLGWQARPALRLAGHLRFLDAEIQNSTESLRNRPRWRGGISMDWNPTSRFHLGLDNQWVGEQYDYQVPIPSQTTVESYSSASFHSRFRLTENVELYGRVDNLFDQDYYESIGFPSPGLDARAGLHFTWAP